MNSLVILGLALVATVVQGGPVKNAAAQCDAQSFSGCMDMFAQGMGLPSMPTDPKVLIRQMEKLLGESGLDGQKQVCKAISGLHDCLGDQYDLCLSVDFLKTTGESAQDATTLVLMAAQQNFLCTTGWDAYQKNFDCINQVTAKDRQILGQCQIDYGKNMSIAWPDAICPDTQVLTTCYTTPFLNECNQASSDVLCQSMQASYGAFYLCLLTCPK